MSNVSELIITLAVFIFLAKSKAVLALLLNMAQLSPYLLFLYKFKISFSESNFLTHKLEQNLGFKTILIEKLNLVQQLLKTPLSSIK